MRFVDEQEEIFRKEIHQCARPRTLGTARNVAGVILDARAETQFLQLLQVELAPHLDALSLEQFALLLELGDAQAQLLANGEHGRIDFLLRRGELLAREDVDGLQRLEGVARQRIEPREALQFLAEELDAQSVFGVGRVQFHHIATHAELAPGEVEVVARILEIHQAGEQLLPAERLPEPQRDDHALVIAPVADAVNAGHRSHHEHIAPRQQRVHRREPQSLDLLVHAAVLLDEGVGARDVGLGLVEVEVADEILHRVVREEALELGVELRRQRLVVRQHQRGPSQLSHHIGDREGLARASDAQQHLMRLSFLQPGNELGDGRRLIARRRIIGFELKQGIGHVV